MSFRGMRRVTVGMAKEQVLILLGPPLATATAPADLERAARKYWPDIKATATEAWAYPLGWHVFFADGRVSDITQYLEAGERR
jgi:hypothetical protein